MRAREANAKNDFVGRQIHLLVAGVKVRVGNCSHTAYRSEFQFGIVHEQRWRRIGGRRRVSDVPAQGSAILIGDASGLAGGTAQQRKFVVQHMGALQLGVRGESTDGDVRGLSLDPAGVFNIKNAEEFTVWQLRLFEQHHEIGSSSKGLPLTRLARYQV